MNISEPLQENLEMRTENISKFLTFHVSVTSDTFLALYCRQFCKTFHRKRFEQLLCQIVKVISHGKDDVQSIREKVLLDTAPH